MRARIALVVLVVFTLGMPGAPSTAQDEAGRTMTFATLAPPGSLLMRGLEAWNREIRRRTERTLQFRFYPGGVQGDEAEVVRKIRSGRIDATGVTGTGLAHIHRPALIFQLPATYMFYEQLEAARRALAPEIEQGMIGQGFRMLGWADIGQARLFSRRPVRTPDDLAACRFWVRADDLIMPVLFSIVRSQTVDLTVPEVLPGLQTGRIDTFLAPPAVAVGLQWAAHATHMSDLPFGVLVGGTVISERTFQSLSAEHQTVLTETATQFHGLARRSSERVEREAIDALLERGIQVVHVTLEDAMRWRQVGLQVRDRVAAQIADPDLIRRASQFGDR